MPDFHTFENELNALATDPVPGFAQAQSDLEQIAKALHQQLFKGSSKANVSLEPGYRVNIGQQIKVVVNFPDRGHSVTLFRAYVSDTGYPIHLDFYGEEMEKADTDDTLRTQVLAFLKSPETLVTIKTLQSLVAG